MDSLQVDSLIFALQKNTAELSAVNDALVFFSGFALGLVFLRSLYSLWTK